MTSKLSIFIFIILGLLLGASATYPKSDTHWEALSEKWHLPPREAGLLIAGFLESISDQETANRFAEDFANTRFPGEMVELSAFLQSFEVDVVDFLSETEVHIVVQTASQDDRVLIKLFMSDAIGSKLMGFDVGPAISAYPKVPEFSDTDAVKTFVQHMVDAGKFSGRILAQKDAQNILNEAYGNADIVSKRAVDKETKFDIGSITKYFTELAMAKLEHEGRLDKGKKIGFYLNNLPQNILDGPTVEQVLQMKGGFGHYYSSDTYNKDRTSFRTIDDFMKVIAEQELEFEPGTDERYSNSGFIVVGAIIEAITGKSYYDYIEEVIFKPAGMKNSGFYPHESSAVNKLAIPYSLVMSLDGLPLDIRSHFSYRGNPSGGSYSTAQDLVKFDRALRDGKILPIEELVKMMPSRGDGKPAKSGLHGYMGQAGGAQGVSTVYFVDFDKDIVVIVLANVDEPISEDLGRMIFRMLRRQT